MPVSGDFRGLEELRSRIASLAGPAFRRDLCASLAEEARTQVVHSFEQARDPYGAPWPPLKHRDGRPLRDTGRLLNSIHGAATDRGFELSTNVVYAAVHEYGARIRVPARAMAHASSGRFVSKRSAGRRSSGSVRVSFRRVGEIVIPQRQYVPEGELGPIWRNALERVADGVVRRRVAA